MPKEDYLLKYLEKLSRVLAAMMGLREKGFPDDGLQLVDETFKEMLSVNLTEITEMSIDRFIELIRKEAYTTGYLEVLAQLVHETAKLYEASGKIERSNLMYTKSLHTYYLLNEKDKTFSFERELILADLRARI